MLFSKVKYYRITKPLSFSESDLSSSLQTHIFEKINKTQVSCHGFVSPSDFKRERPVYGVGDSFLVCLRVDSKSIPASSVKKKTNYRVAELEKSKGEKASKEEKDDIKEQVMSEMISAFPLDLVKSKFTYVLLMPNDNLVAINSISPNECELVLAILRTALGSLPIVEFEVDSLPSAIMTNWVRDESSIPEEIVLLQEAQLRDEIDDKGAVVQVKKQDLNTEEMVMHLDAGKAVVMLALEWNDTLVFKLKDDLTVSGISYTDFSKEQLKADSGDGDEYQKFDSELVLTVDSLKMLAPNLQQLFS